MERPLCPLCKVKHYAREAHVFKSVEGEVLGRAAKRASVKVDEDMGNKGGGDGEGQAVRLAESLPSNLRGLKPAQLALQGVRFDRNAYQREYMRVRRAVKAGRTCLLKV